MRASARDARPAALVVRAHAALGARDFLACGRHAYDVHGVRRFFRTPEGEQKRFTVERRVRVEALARAQRQRRVALDRAVGREQTCARVACDRQPGSDMLVRRCAVVRRTGQGR